MQLLKKYNMAFYWVFIALCLGFSIWKNGVGFAFIGFVIAGVIMELIARGSYYLIKNDEEQNTPEINDEADNDNDFNINKYVDKNKRTFGEANTYLATGIGALMGWKLFIVVFIFALFFQILFIIPQFIKELYKQKRYRFLFSLTSFIILCILYFVLNSVLELNFYLVCAFSVVLIFLALDSAIQLRQRVNSEGYHEIPFGSSLIISMILVYFYGYQILSFILNYFLKPM